MVSGHDQGPVIGIPVLGGPACLRQYAPPPALPQRRHRARLPGPQDAEELCETTMDIKSRILRQITVDDAMAADEVFSKLMGEEVEPRREFIETNATYVENLDI